MITQLVSKEEDFGDVDVLANPACMAVSSRTLKMKLPLVFPINETSEGPGLGTPCSCLEAGSQGSRDKGQK